MTERLVEAVGGDSGAAFAASVSNFIISHNYSLRETRDLYFRLLSNLKSNTKLLARVRAGEITAEQLCTMSEADMAGDEVRREREEAKKASIRDVTMAKEMMIAKQTKAGVEYIAVAGDKMTKTDMFDEKLTLTGTEGREDEDEAEDGERKMTTAESADGVQHAGVGNGLSGSGEGGVGEDEFLSFDEIEQRQHSDTKAVDYESKYASDMEDDDVTEQTRGTPTIKRHSDTLDGEQAVQTVARKKSKVAHSPSSDDGANSSGVDVGASVSSAGVVSLVLSPKLSAQAVPNPISPHVDKRNRANRADAIELDLDQPSVSAVLHPSAALPPGAPSANLLPNTPPALTPATPPQSPPSIIPLPSLQPVASSPAAGLFLGPLQSASRWLGQLYFNGHNTTIPFTGRLMGVAGHATSNTAVKALSNLPAPPATVNIAGREPTSEASRLLHECLTSPRLMALLYVLQPEAAEAAAMEEFCAFHAEKQRVAIADMRKESGLFYRFGRMGAMGEAIGKELPLDLFARSFSGVKGLKDARSYYCVVVYAEKRPSGGVPSAVVPRRQESSSSVSSIASTDSRASGSRQRSSQASVVTPPPPASTVPTVYPAFPAPPAAAQPSTFTSSPTAPPPAIPTSLAPSAPAVPTPAAAPAAPAVYAGYHPPPPAAGYYIPAQQYPGYMPMIPEQQTATVPPHSYPPYMHPQYNQPTYPMQPQHHTQPPSQPQPRPPPHSSAAPATTPAAMGGTSSAAPDNTDWIQVRKFLESIKTLGTASPPPPPHHPRPPNHPSYCHHPHRAPNSHQPLASSRPDVTRLQVAGSGRMSGLGRLGRTGTGTVRISGGTMRS